MGAFISTHPQKYIEIDVETYVDNHMPFNLAVALFLLLAPTLKVVTSVFHLVMAITYIPL